MPPQRLTNYILFTHNNSPRQVGHLDHATSTITPLSLPSGTPLTSLYQVIEASDILSSSALPLPSALPLSSVQILPPFPERDVLAVGKNYLSHAAEFNRSGFDASDTVDRPSHPVIFTKRSTSIIPHGDEVLLHPEFTSTADYEGEVGVIIGRAGFRVSEADAWDHVWGYTIINDITARERQRDHKQFYLGKSPDTFCPMGPIAVPKEDLPETLTLKTHVNGQLRQEATTKDLIFSIPHLIATLSAATTLRPGDVIATGTPAGVGIGLTPPVYLKPNDTISISISGLGTLTNKIASPATVNPTLSRMSSSSSFTLTNASRTLNATTSLTQINSKPLSYQTHGSGSTNIIFVHGLGGTKDFFTPLTSSLATSAKLHVYDFEGQGLSPTHPLSVISIPSLVSDLSGIFSLAEVTPDAPAVLVGHSMGSLIAIQFALQNPSLVSKLILIGPPPSPLPEPAANALLAAAAQARSGGMSAVVNDAVAAGVSEHTRTTNPLATTAVRLSLLGQDPEGYAKASSALASFTEPLELEKLTVETLVVSGGEDVISPPAVGEEYGRRIGNAKSAVLPNVGHWHLIEDPNGVAEALKGFL
ncbi:fumarylacetoacetate hydrolase [Colletotrichum sojae]|uniref:Fumarylacetoacetate hydrolase n=1 Tax=Colletotrichum sojae TaxID=2175907 RepID=A0A8H6J7Z2_9PEZI|nr:fumarylacetoacetate hydrolase [Colletotrichum sojae]